MSLERVAGLEEEVAGLYEAVDERDRRIRELEEFADRRATDDDGEVGELRADLERKGEELEECHDAASGLREELRQARAERDSLADDKRRLEEQLRSHRSQLDRQERKVAEAERAAEDVRRLQKDGCGEQYRLEVENQTLRAAMDELEENEDELVVEVENISKERFELERNFRSVCVKNDRLQGDLDSLSRQAIALQKDKEALQHKVESELDTIRSLHVERKKEAEAHKQEISKLMLELEEEQQKNSVVEAKAALSHGARTQQCLEKHVSNLRKELQKVISELAICNEDKISLEQDLQSTCRALESQKREHTDNLQSAIQKERQDAKRVEATLEAATRREKEYQSRCVDLEEQNKHIGETLRRVEERNSWYEKGHGLSDAVRYQNKLEADIRRRDHDMKKLSVQLGEKTDRCQILAKACQLLKEEASLPADYPFDDDEIKDALQHDDNRLKSQNTELIRQVERLETDRLQLMKQLRHNAAQIGENGIRFLGLSAEQVLKVTEFASNLRDGSVELPMNDRSIDLMTQLVELKAEKESHLVTIERLEREIIGLGGNDTEHKQTSSELAVMRQVLEEIQGQNKALRDQVELLTEKKASESPQRFDDVISPIMKERILEVIGETPAEMPSKAQVQFVCLVREYDKACQELSVVKASMQRWQMEQRQHADCASLKREKHQINTPHTDEEVQTTSGKNLVAQKFPGVDFRRDPTLKKAAEDIIRQLVLCLEDLGALEDEKMEQHELIELYESSVSSTQRYAAELFQRQKEFRRETSSERKGLHHNEPGSETPGRDGWSKNPQCERCVVGDSLKSKKQEQDEIIMDHKHDKKSASRETHEVELSRKYECLRAQLNVELKARERAEQDAVELEVYCCRRIIFLEQWRASAIEEMARLQRSLEKTVPNRVYQHAIRELESSREECMVTLHSLTDLQQYVLGKKKDVPSMSEAMELANKAKKQCLMLEEMYDGGLTATEAKSISAKHEDAIRQIGELKQEAKKQRQLAAVASAQVESLQTFRLNYTDEIASLQDICSMKDSESDESETIGKLKREVTLAKQSNNDLGRKNERLKMQLRDDKTKLHSLEISLQECTEELFGLRERYRIQIIASHTAIRSLSDRGASLHRLGSSLASHTKLQPSLVAAAFATPTSSSYPLFLIKSVSEGLSKIVAQSRLQDDKLPALEAENDALREENLALKDSKESLDVGSETSSEKERISKLSEELRLSKTELVRLRRDATLHQEKSSRLKVDLKKYQVMLQEAEEARMLAETRFCDQEDRVFLCKLFAVKDTTEKISHTDETKKVPNSVSKDHKYIQENIELVYEPDECSAVTVDMTSATAKKLKSALEKLEHMREEAKRSHEELKNYKWQCEHLQDKLDLSLKGAQDGSSDEIATISNAAQGTILNLKNLLDEKNNIITEYKRKLKGQTRGSVLDESSEFGMKTALNESNYTIERLREAAEKVEFLDTPSSDQNLSIEVCRHLALVRQVEEAEALITEKNTSIRQLEEKLHEVKKAKAQSEERCKKALHEVDCMRKDISVLAGKVSSAETRTLEAVKSCATEKEITKLNQQLEDKEQKLRTLGLALDKLREDKRIKSSKQREKVRREDKENLKSTISSDEVTQKLMSDISKVKATLCRTRRGKEKVDSQLTESRKKVNDAFQEISKLELEIRRLKKEVADKDRVVMKSQENMSKLKEKARIAKAQNDESKDDSRNKEMIDTLEQRVLALQNQNAALRSTLASSRLKAEATALAPRRKGLSAKEEHTQSGALLPEHQKLQLLEKELRGKQLKISQLEAKLRKQASRGGVPDANIDAFSTDEVSQVITLEELRRALFACEHENIQLKRVKNLEQPMQIEKLEHELKVLKSSREDARRQVEQLKSLLEEEKCSDAIIDWMAIQKQVDQERHSRHKAEQMLCEKETHVAGLQYDMREYQVNEERYMKRIQEISAAMDLLQKSFNQENRGDILVTRAEVKSLEERCGTLREENKKLKRTVLAKEKENQPIANVHPDHTNLLAKMDEMQTRIKDLEGQIFLLKETAKKHKEMGMKSSGVGRREVDRKHDEVGEANDAVDKSMQEEMSKLREELSSARQENEQLSGLIDNLQQEKDRLSNELHAFDLDFFEEIEDLKMNFISMKQKYEVASKKLQEYDGVL